MDALARILGPCGQDALCWRGTERDVAELGVRRPPNGARDRFVDPEGLLPQLCPRGEAWLVRSRFFDRVPQFHVAHADFSYSLSRTATR